MITRSRQAASGRLTFFNTASGGPMEDKTSLWILNFRDQERIAMLDEAQGSLSGFEFHVLPAPGSSLSACQ
jgi:hypothetical protein